MNKYKEVIVMFVLAFAGGLIGLGVAGIFKFTLWIGFAIGFVGTAIAFALIVLGAYIVMVGISDYFMKLGK